MDHAWKFSGNLAEGAQTHSQNRRTKFIFWSLPTKSRPLRARLRLSRFGSHSESWVNKSPLLPVTQPIKNPAAFANVQNAEAPNVFVERSNSTPLVFWQLRWHYRTEHTILLCVAPSHCTSPQQTHLPAGCQSSPFAILRLPSEHEEPTVFRPTGPLPLCLLLKHQHILRERRPSRACCAVPDHRGSRNSATLCSTYTGATTMAQPRKPMPPLSRQPAPSTAKGHSMGELAASGGQLLSPLGLTAPFSGYDDCGPYPFEKRQNAEHDGPLAHDLYIWNGRSALALTKAVTLTSASSSAQLARRRGGHDPAPAPRRGRQLVAASQSFRADYLGRSFALSADSTSTTSSRCSAARARRVDTVHVAALLLAARPELAVVVVVPELQKALLRTPGPHELGESPGAPSISPASSAGNLGTSPPSTVRGAPSPSAERGGVRIPIGMGGLPANAFAASMVDEPSALTTGQPPSSTPPRPPPHPAPLCRRPRRPSHRPSDSPPSAQATPRPRRPPPPPPPRQRFDQPSSVCEAGQRQPEGSSPLWTELAPARWRRRRRASAIVARRGRARRVGGHVAQPEWPRLRV